MRNLWRSIGVALWASFAASACATAGESETQRRIVAVGDLHGDYDAYLDILESAGLSDKRARWTGGDTIFVQTGDIPDRGPETRKIIDHLRKLQKSAARKGGQVIALVGNHEAMNMTGDLRYVTPGEFEAFEDRSSERRREATYEANRDALETFYLERDPTLSSEAIRDAWFADTPLGKLEHQAAWRADGDIGEWVASHDAAMKIGDTLFVHGGLSAEYSTFSLADINARVRTAMQTNDNSEGSILYDQLGPLWYRGLIQRDPPPGASNAEETPPAPPRLSIADEVTAVLDAYNVKRIVVGHTPALQGITASQNGRVIQIDTGISDYYGGPRTYLEIIGDTLIAHNLDTGEARTLSDDLETAP